MSRTVDQVGLECPHCHAPLTLTIRVSAARGDSAPATGAVVVRPPAPPAGSVRVARGEVAPRPVAEVLADLYGGRRRLDPPTARSGAARARAGLAAARAVATERAARQALARAGRHQAAETAPTPPRRSWSRPRA